MSKKEQDDKLRIVEESDTILLLRSKYTNSNLKISKNWLRLSYAEGKLSFSSAGKAVLEGEIFTEVYEWIEDRHWEMMREGEE